MCPWLWILWSFNIHLVTLILVCFKNPSHWVFQSICSFIENLLLNTCNGYWFSFAISTVLFFSKFMFFLSFLNLYLFILFFHLSNTACLQCLLYLSIEYLHCLASCWATSALSPSLSFTVGTHPLTPLYTSEPHVTLFHASLWLCDCLFYTCGASSLKFSLYCSLF